MRARRARCDNPQESPPPTIVPKGPRRVVKERRRTLRMCPLGDPLRRAQAGVRSCGAGTHGVAWMRGRRRWRRVNRRVVRTHGLAARADCCSRGGCSRPGNHRFGARGSRAMRASGRALLGYAEPLRSKAGKLNAADQRRGVHVDAPTAWRLADAYKPRELTQRDLIH